MFFQRVTLLPLISCMMFIGMKCFAPLPCYYGERVGVRGITPVIKSFVWFADNQLEQLAKLAAAVPIANFANFAKSARFLAEERR